MATPQEIQKAQEELAKWQLGSTSSLLESGHQPGDATSAGAWQDGKGDAGGASYGSYQFATARGTLDKYLKATHNYNHAFDGLTPKTDAFNDKWGEVGKNDAAAFHQSQHEFVIKEHYAPVKAALAAKHIDLSERGKAVQDMLWSTGVQYGANGAASKIQRALNEDCLNYENVSDRRLIEAVSDNKYKHYQEDFRSSAPNWKGISNRILNEKNLLLKLNGYEEIVKEYSKEVDQRSLNQDNFRRLEINEQNRAIDPIPASHIAPSATSYSDPMGTGDAAAIQNAVSPASAEKTTSKPAHDKISANDGETVPAFQAGTLDYHADVFAQLDHLYKAAKSDNPDHYGLAVEDLKNSKFGVDFAIEIKELAQANEKFEQQQLAQQQAQQVTMDSGPRMSGPSFG